jgi:hypothetical protein
MVVERPRRGNTQPMKAPDFLNLAGRAGRLQREFHGNVWCLRPEYWPVAPADQAELPHVRSAFEAVLADGGTDVRRVLADEATRDSAATAATAAGRLLTEYVFTGRTPELSTDAKLAAELQVTLSVVKSLQLTLPREVFIRNGSILPTRLESLYTFLQNEQSLNAWIPPPPFSGEFYETLSSIFELVNRELHNSETIRHRFDAWLATRWIRQSSLQQMIDASVKWRVKKDLPVDVQKIIRQIIRRIERWIRHQYVRYLRAYNDVLAVALRDRNRETDAEALIPIYLFLEWGACDRTILSLISLGFSRTASLVLKRRLPFPTDASPEACRQIVLKTNLTSRRIPPVIKREAAALLGKSA